MYRKLVQSNIAVRIETNELLYDLLEFRCKYYQELRDNILIKSKFHTVEIATNFYYGHAMEVNFIVRNVNLKFREDGRVQIRKFVSSKKGRRHQRWYNLQNRVKNPRANTRVGCPDCFSIGYSK